jgi:hypothetical protein
MEIERTRSGTITIDGKTYEHDVIIRSVRRSGKAEEEAVEEALRDLACLLEGRSEVRL